MSKRNNGIGKMTALALLGAIVVVLQIICTFIKFGPFSITLALVPVVIGAAIYGWKVGAGLGFIFSAVVFISGIIGWDGGFINMMMQYNPVATVLVCFGKGTAAGLVAGLLYRPVSKANDTVAAIVAGAAAPIVNTGLFAATMLTVFSGFLSQNATAGGYASPVVMLFTAWIGVNFIVEFATNLVLSSVTVKIARLFAK
ncbi:MAG: ECF transporter S component [Clostridia bacterium]|nr:ECF transporter S component [Clostridia bacterium]